MYMQTHTRTCTCTHTRACACLASEEGQTKPALSFQPSSSVCGDLEPGMHEADVREQRHGRGAGKLEPRQRRTKGRAEGTGECVPVTS